MLHDRLPAIAGLRYVPSYLTPDTQVRLIAAVDAHTWQTSVNRGVQIYGYRYTHRTREAFRVGDLPVWARELAERLRHDGLSPDLPNQLVANDYPVGSGISAHIDQAVFGTTVISISLGGTCIMRFVHAQSKRVEECLLEPGSALVLAGSARWDWTHEIPAQAVDVWRMQHLPRSRRVSLTFRAVATQTSPS